MNPFDIVIAESTGDFNVLLAPTAGDPTSFISVVSATTTLALASSMRATT